MGLLTTFHFLLAVFYGYTVYYYVWGLNAPEQFRKIRSENYGQFKYLTFWDLLMQFGFFTLCFLSNVYSAAVSRKRKTSFERFLDSLFSTIIFSTAIFVSSTFWGIYAVDRELIFPQELDSFFPVWLNHAVHTLPTAAVFIELFAVQRYTKTWKRGIAYTLLLPLVYLIWILYIAHETGHWVYPILAKLDTTGRAIFIVVLAGVFAICYTAGHLLYNLRWGSSSKRQQRQKKKSQ